MLAKRINSAVFPGTQGGPLEHVIAAKAVCFGEALKPEFKDYARKIVENAQAMAAELQARGVKLVSGGTDNHLMLLDLRDEECTGKELEARLDSVHITANKNTVPGETRSPFVTSGVRLGTPAVTTRGMGEAEMKVIADCIADCIWHYDEKKDDISARVLALTKAFPLYESWIFDVSKPLPLEEVSPKVTERASSVPKNICTAISISFCKSDATAVFFISLQRPCPLRRCAPALPRGAPISSAAGSDMLCLSYLVGWNRGQAPRALTLNEEQKTSHQRKEKDTMSNYQMQMPAQYTSIGDDEMVLLCGGETTAWQTFQDIGRVLNYVARIFSAGSSIVNNVVTIVNYFNKLEDLLPVIGEV